MKLLGLIGISCLISKAPVYHYNVQVLFTATSYIAQLSSTDGSFPCNFGSVANTGQKSFSTTRCYNPATLMAYPPAEFDIPSSSNQLKKGCSRQKEWIWVNWILLYFKWWLQGQLFEWCMRSIQRKRKLSYQEVYSQEDHH